MILDRVILTSVSTSAVFSFVDVITQQVEIKFRKRGWYYHARKLHSHSSPQSHHSKSGGKENASATAVDLNAVKAELDQVVASSSSSSSSSTETVSEKEKGKEKDQNVTKVLLEVPTTRPRGLRFNWARLSRFAYVGLAMGSLIIPVMTVAASVLPEQGWLSLLERAIVVELFLVPPTVAISLAAGATLEDNPTQAAGHKFQNDYIELIAFHFLMAPCWMLPWTSANLPFPGFSARIPASIILAFIQLPAIAVLSWKSFRRQGMTLKFNWFFELSDLFSKYTAYSLLFWAGCGYVNCVGQLIVEAFGTRGVAWDPLFALFPYVPYGWSVDFLIMMSVAAMVGHMLIRSHPPFPVMLRRLWLVHGALLFTRGFTVPMFGSLLPSPDLGCISNTNFPFFFAPLFVELGIGHTCMDMMFSGHTCYFVLAGCYFQRYTKNPTLKVTFWIYTSACLAMVVATHLHYTVDVVGALAITLWYWEVFHGLLELDTAEGLPADAGVFTRVKFDAARFVQYVSHYTGPEQSPTNAMPAAGNALPQTIIAPPPANANDLNANNGNGRNGHEKNDIGV